MKGDQGKNGVQGLKGDQGVKGNQGDKGATGPTGPTGPQGNNGVQGLKGDQGKNGVQGLKGDQGAPGGRGKNGVGVQGPIGATPTIDTLSGLYINFEGTPSVTTVENGTNTILLEFNYLKGAQGAQGAQGSKGATPSTSNFVTTNTNQTISGNKAFTGTQCKFTNYVVFSNGAGTSSDIRFKTNITPITNVLEDILKIDIFNYTWDKEGEKCFDTLGISAQQMEELGEPFSKLVHIAEDEDKTRSVEYSKLSVITIKAIQEMYEENKILKNKIHELELKIDNLISK